MTGVQTCALPISEPAYSLASDVLEDYAQKQGYTLVLDESQQGGPVLVAVSQADITKAVVDAYNLKSGVPALPAHPTAAAPRSAPQSAKPATAQ